MFCLLITLSAHGSENCFLAKENGKLIKQEGACTKRHSPFSTFKVPLALMGFESGFLKTSSDPLLKFSDALKEQLGELHQPQKYPIMLLHEKDQTPATWMQYSVIWYSQEIAKNLGIDKFQAYANKLNYGNKDVSGTPGKSNALLSSWIGSSLQISPLEQLEFIDKLSKQELPLSSNAQNHTKELIALENLPNDWKLYGKTGGSRNAGWFIGWIEKDDRRIAFTQYIEIENSPISAGKVAKELVKDKLISVVL